MPVKLFTGLPGAGKTACLVAEILELREKQPDRPIYQRGINGLAPGLAEELTDEQLHNWWTLAPGAIICIDECQEQGLMPQDKGQPAHWVQRITKVRHEGMDFLLTTQHPNNMSAYVRRLVDHHVHAVRKFNTQVVSRYMWGRCMDTPEKPSSQKAATATTGMLPKGVFDLYKSASMHTMKKRVPFKVYVLFGCLLAAVCIAVAAPYVYRHLHESVTGVKDGGGGAAIATGGKAESTLRSTDYAKWVTPRVEGLPWTAPAYDERQAVAKPAVYCIAVDDGRCSCISEQGTTLIVKRDQCRLIAANGVYNPFLEPSQAETYSRKKDDGSPRSEVAKPQNGANVDPSASVGDADALKVGTGVQEYTPPGYGHWSAMPLPGHG
jgi:zona occludens toxin